MYTRKNVNDEILLDQNNPPFLLSEELDLSLNCNTSNWIFIVDYSIILMLPQSEDMKLFAWNPEGDKTQERYAYMINSVALPVGDTVN